MRHSYLFAYDPGKKEIIRTQYKEIDSVPEEKYDTINSFTYKGDGILPMISNSNNFDNYLDKLKAYLIDTLEKQQIILNFLSEEIIKKKASVKNYNGLLKILDSNQLHLISVDKTDVASEI